MSYRSPAWRSADAILHAGLTSSSSTLIQSAGFPSALLTSPLIEPLPFYQMAAHKNLSQLAAALCLVLLVVSEMAGTSEAAGCDIFQMMPCVAASRSNGVRPSTQCCRNVATMGRGIAGAKCLCSLVSQPLAKSQGVVPRIALGIPQKCGIPVPRGFTCQGIRVPGS